MRRGSVDDLIGRLRRCGTLGDSELRPYAEADIRLEPVRLDTLVPLAKYVLDSELQQIRTLDRMLSSHDVDVFDLTFGMVWPDEERPLAPPIVEEWRSEGLLLVDGLHRAWVAREGGRATITCAVIRGASVPLVPLPVGWDEVKIFEVGTGPSGEQKRSYRFKNSEALRDAVPRMAHKVTESNFQYFLYRNLDALGSTGIRPSSGTNTEAE